MIRSTWLALALAAVAVTATATLAQAPPPADESGLWRALGLSRPSTPAEAPPFALKDLAGQETRLDQFRGRVVMVYFWTTW